MPHVETRFVIYKTLLLFLQLAQHNFVALHTRSSSCNLSGNFVTGNRASCDVVFHLGTVTTVSANRVIFSY